jgi:predicted DNA-binding transcriptional regulator AlpA
MAQKTLPPALSAFDSLPDSALVSVRDLALLMGCSPNTIWRRSKAGAFPAGIRVSPQQTRWRVGDVRQALAALAGR